MMIADSRGGTPEPLSLFERIQTILGEQSDPDAQRAALQDAWQNWLVAADALMADIAPLDGDLTRIIMALTPDDRQQTRDVILLARDALSRIEHALRAIETEQEDDQS